MCQPKHYPRLSYLRLLLVVNPETIDFSNSALKEKIIKKIFSNRRVGKLMYLFEQEKVFDIWWEMDKNNKIWLYEQNCPYGLDFSVKNLLEDTEKQLQAKYDLLGDSWDYPIGKLETITQKTANGNKSLDYWQFTAMPLKNNDNIGFLYLFRDAHFDLKPNRMFIKNDENHTFPTIWQSLYELWDGKSKLDGFFLGGSFQPNFELKDIEWLRKRLVTKTEVEAYIIQQNRQVAETFFAANNDYHDQFLKQKQNKRNESISLLTSQNKSALESVRLFLQSKRDELKKRLDAKDARSRWDEHSYQELLLEIFPFIFPQYTHFIREYHFNIDNNTLKKEDIPDFIAATANLSVDILEIKKPSFNLCYKTSYRKNYVFSHEVQGMISQIQKYIYNLERNSKREEPKLTKIFKEKANFSKDNLHIRSPKAIVIIGRSPSPETEQMRDLEIYKRRYQDIADFLTYDDVIMRMDQIINRQLGKINNT